MKILILWYRNVQVKELMQICFIWRENHQFYSTELKLQFDSV